MAAAFMYADGGGRLPEEIEILGAIDRFGAQPVTGRAYLGAGEIRRMTAAENVIRYYRERAQSDNWAEWAKQHPGAAALLAKATKAAADDDERTDHTPGG